MKLRQRRLTDAEQLAARLEAHRVITHHGQPCDCASKQQDLTKEAQK